MIALSSSSLVKKIRKACAQREGIVQMFKGVGTAETLETQTWVWRQDGLPSGSSGKPFKCPQAASSFVKEKIPTWLSYSESQKLLKTPDTSRNSHSHYNNQKCWLTLKTPFTRGNRQCLSHLPSPEYVCHVPRRPLHKFVYLFLASTSPIFPARCQGHGNGQDTGGSCPHLAHSPVTETKIKCCSLWDRRVRRD